jgi:hypothetical protein
MTYWWEGVVVPFVCLFFRVFFFWGIGGWTQDILLSRQMLYCLSHAPILFLLLFFRKGLSLFAQGLASNFHPPSFVSCNWAYTYDHHVRLVYWDKLLLTFCPGWPLAAFLPIFTSQGAGCSFVNNLGCHQNWPFVLQRYLQINPRRFRIIAHKRKKVPRIISRVLRCHALLLLYQIFKKSNIFPSWAF